MRNLNEARVVVVGRCEGGGLSISGEGFDGARLAPGRYELVLKKPVPVSGFMVQVQVAGEAAAETTLTMVRRCKAHGYDCPTLEDDLEGIETSRCADEEIPLRAPRWQAMVKTFRSSEDAFDIERFEVNLWCLPKAETPEEATLVKDVPPLRDDADFYVLAYSLPEGKG